MKKSGNAAILLARILVSVLFIVAGWGKIVRYEATQLRMEAMGIPDILLLLTILLEVGGGLAVLFGLLTRTTSLCIAVFTVIASVLFHGDFSQGLNSLMFMKNMSITGAFLLLALIGPGAYSLDRLLKKKW